MEITHDGNIVQAIPGRNINQGKLRSLLVSRWDRNYSVEVSGNPNIRTPLKDLSCADLKATDAVE
jgi:hypothetical protein